MFWLSSPGEQCLMAPTSAQCRFGQLVLCISKLHTASNMLEARRSPPEARIEKVES
jgi:hypothetical protein